METEIARQLRVEARHPHGTLSEEDGNVVVRREHLDRVTHALDAPGADEHTGERRAAESADLERRLERIALAAVAVAADRDVDAPERLLVGTAVEHLTRQQDHPCARSEHGHPVVQTRAERVAQARGVEETA